MALRVILDTMVILASLHPFAMQVERMPGLFRHRISITKR
jgi:hypothetical protein